MCKILKSNFPQSSSPCQLWMECLIRCQAAVLGVIWRTYDALGVDKAKDSTLVNVFASSGFAKRYNLFKISLHFIWEELHVSSHESKAIRNANLAFVASKQCGPLHRLLANAHKVLFLPNIEHFS